jgi:CYTH domain-containing protein
MVEIERKFLVISDEFKNGPYHKTYIVQGFLSTHPDRTVRVRLQGEVGYITIKGRSNEKGTTRAEWEWEIASQEAETLLKICEPGIIEKMRYEVVYQDHTFEVDEFLGENQGLTMAEIELISEAEAFDKPAWLGAEVTGDIRYYNSQLSKQPFKTWKNED